MLRVCSPHLSSPRPRGASWRKLKRIAGRFWFDWWRWIWDRETLHPPFALHSKKALASGHQGQSHRCKHNKFISGSALLLCVQRSQLLYELFTFVWRLEMFFQVDVSPCVCDCSGKLFRPRDNYVETKEKGQDGNRWRTAIDNTPNRLNRWRDSRTPRQLIEMLIYEPFIHVYSKLLSELNWKV